MGNDAIKRPGIETNLKEVKRVFDRMKLASDIKIIDVPTLEEAERSTTSEPVIARAQFFDRQTSLYGAFFNIHQTLIEKKDFDLGIAVLSNIDRQYEELKKIAEVAMKNNFQIPSYSSPRP